MKYNNETHMEPRLQEAIQTLLDIATANFRALVNDPIPMARLGGICTAIHAYTGEIWSVKPDTQMRYVLVNEDETEYITPHQL